MPRIGIKIWIVSIIAILLFIGISIFRLDESSEIDWDILKEDFSETSNLSISGGEIENGSLIISAMQSFDSCSSSKAYFTVDLDYDKFLIEIEITDIWISGSGTLLGSFMSKGRQFYMDLEWGKVGIYQYVYDHGNVSEYRNGTLLREGIAGISTTLLDGFYFFAEGCSPDLNAGAGIAIDRIYITSQDNALEIIRIES
jgi:hypothetical protein